MSALATRGVTSSPVASTSVSPALSSSAAPSVAVAVVSPVSPGASASTSPAPLPLFLEASGAIELIAEPPARTLKTGTQLTVSRVDASVFVLSSQVWCSPALASSVPKTTLWQGRRVVVQQLTLLVDVDSRQLSEGVHTALITVRAVLDSNSVSVLIPVQVDVRAAQVQVAFSGDAVAAVGTSVVSVLSLMNRGTGAALVQIRVLPGATQQPGQVHHRGNLLLNDSTHGFQSTAGDRKITVALQGGTAVRIQALAPGSSLQPLREGRYAANVEISANVPILSVSDTVSIDSDNEQRAVVLWRVRAAALFVYPSRARRLMRSGREASLPTQLYTLRSELSVRARLNSTAARASLYDAGMPAIFPPAQPPWTVHQLVRSFSQPQHTMAMFNSSSLNALLELRAWSSTPGRPLTLDTSTYAMTVMPGSACAQDSIWRLATRNALPPQSAWPVRTPLRVEIFLQDCGGFATDQLPAQAGLSAVLQPYDSQLSVQYSDVLVVAGTTGMRRAEFSPAQLGAFNLQLLLGSSPLTAEGWLTADTVLSIVPPQCLRSEFLQRSARGDQCECVPGAGRREISGQPLWASPCDSCVAGSFSYRREDLQDHLCVRCPSGTFSPAQHATACIRCPQGAACTNGLLTILDGYYVTADTDWRRPHTIRLLSCVHPAACKAPAANAIARALHGNFTDTDADNLATQCMYGHTGTLCGTCTSGQVMGPQGCTPCHHTRNALWLSAVFSAIVAVIIVALLVRSLLKTLQAVEQTGTKDSAAPASYSFALMRIATNWLQTFATIALIPLPQPPAVRNSSSQVGATAELSPLSSDVIRCALQYDWATRWWLTLALYAGILVCLPLGALPVAAAARRWSNARNARFTSAQFASAVFVMTFSILFPPVLRQLLQPFEEYGELVDGTRVLRSDTAVTVEGHADLSGIRVFATIVLVMWVGMLPVAIFSALWCQRNTIRSLSSGNSCGASRGPRSKRHTSWARTVAYATAPLYSAYRVHGSGILFEALVLARGVLQVLIPVLLQHDPNAQAMWLAALFFLSALAQTILRPLQHAVLNRLSALTLASLAGTALAILAYATRIKQNDLLFSNDAAGSDKESQLPGSKDIAYLYASTIAVVNLLLAALLVWHLLRNVWKRARWIRVERRRRSSAAFGALSSGNARSTDNSNATPTNSSFLARAHRSQGGDPPEGLDCRDPQLGNAAICSVPISTHAAATGTQVAFKS